jgi:hypothetical protein
LILPVSNCDSNASVRVASNPFPARDLLPSSGVQHGRGTLPCGRALL